jgi:PKD repeat protein
VYDWDWDDGTSMGIGSSPQHTYSESGDYTVILTVTDFDGISDSDTTAATIDPPPIAPQADAGGSYSGTAGVAVDFDGSASNDPDGTVVRYDWDFGDRNFAPDGGPAPSHTYAGSGLYNVRLTVTDNDDLTNLDITAAIIGNAANLPPTADAGGPYGGIVNQGIQFYGGNSSDPDGTIEKTVWDFGDSGTSSQLNPTHTYTTSGPHPVTLTVTDDDGATDSDTALVIVGATLIPPTAEADGPYIGEAGAPVTFDGTGSDDPDGSITDYDWTFGDGNTGTGPTPDHTYGAGSRYHVTLQVTDDDGLPDADGTTVRIGEFSQPPTADAGGPYHGRVGAPVTFDGTGSDDPDGDIVRYDWDFGDGTTVTDAGPAPDHTYAEDGRYRVTLTVTDNSGETDTGITVVTVGVGNLPPEADAGDSVNGKVRRDITFDGTGSSDRDGNVVSYAWEFGDGNTGTGPNPTHSYADAGKYRVTMTVKDNDGATSSDVTLADVESKSGGGGGGGGGSCFINTMMGQ